MGANQPIPVIILQIEADVGSVVDLAAEVARGVVPEAEALAVGELVAGSDLVDLAARAVGAVARGVVGVLGRLVAADPGELAVGVVDVVQAQDGLVVQLARRAAAGVELGGVGVRRGCSRIAKDQPPKAPAATVGGHRGVTGGSSGAIAPRPDSTSSETASATEKLEDPQFCSRPRNCPLKLASSAESVGAFRLWKLPEVVQ